MTRAGVRDVTIVGGGDVGTAIARELSRFELDITLLEASPDIGAGTSKANTALLHTGFDAPPGTLESRLVARGHDLLLRYAERVGIPVERTGAVLVAWSEAELRRLPQIAERARANGYRRARELSPRQLYELEPHLAAGAHGALSIPDEHIVCPFTPPLAFASEAVLAGCELRRGERLVAVERPGGGAHELRTSRGRLSTRWLINAAGLESDRLDAMMGHERFQIAPRRGELIVFDKLARRLISQTILPVPSERTKGVIIAPTVFGNVLVGPTAEDVQEREDTSCTAAGLSSLREHAKRMLPALAGMEVTATYAGLRAATASTDYQIHVDPGQRYVCVGGIRSTGLTASMAIAEHVRDELERAGLALRERPHHAEPRMAPIGEASVRPYADAQRIAADPRYGRIVCFCERVTQGEIEDALAGPIPPVDLDGLRRRTRAQLGRCQGFYCGARLASILEAHRRR
ncbi:MAG TPA: NAD(P)/FAD-dependent oxidoreductase [Solirubrobacteraceae bacterium]|nr:NAD(P)/FAD-dependent oxidoreductase [Solirubrobacteraceae bacterium]